VRPLAAKTSGFPLVVYIVGYHFSAEGWLLTAQMNQETPAFAHMVL